MRRSTVNQVISNAIQFAESHSLPLPPFAYWGVDEWRSLGEENREIADNMLGWDVTDFGSGDFEKVGLTVFTFRNGNFYHKDAYPKPYAEKLLLVGDGQILPYHYHWSKMEDIINRGGGDVLIRVYNSTKDGRLADTDVSVHMDGRTLTVPAGTQIKLTPGESITIQQYMYHDFEQVSGTGPVLLGEVSMCNDDNADNRFYEAIGRFPAIEEDEPPYRLLCNEYPEAK